MPSRVLETILTGRNLLSPVLVSASRDVDAFDAKVAASQARAAESASVGAAKQESAAAKVAAANTRTAASSEASAAKVEAANLRAAESMRGFADVTESSTVRAGASLAGLATKGLPLVVGAVAILTGKMAGDYQQLVTKLETTAGETHANLGMVSQGMLDMAGKVGVSADELAKGMYTVESAGFHGADALKVLKASAQGARQENADLGKVTDAVSTILHDYHLPASKAADVTSQLVDAVSHGKTTFDALTGSLHSVTPLAAKLNIPLADVAGTLSAMTASGESADQATQNMHDALQHLMTPLPSQVSELASLGITAQDMSDKLGTRGLAGTMQDISQAILTKMGPSGKVLLDSFNQSKQASHDLQVMIGAMPPSLAKLSQSLLDGTTSQGNYRKAAQALGGQAGVLGDNFLGLYKSSDGFNQALKTGGPAAQSYESALQKATGTVAGMNVALMVTGENAGATNAAIADIAGSSADAAGNVKGWDEVQGNLNQKLAEAGGAAGKLAIEAGQHLLPVLTDVVGWVGDTAIPGIEHLGGAVGGVIHWFTQLPGPVKEATVALGLLAAANKVGVFTALASGAERLGAGVAAIPGKLQSFAGGWGPLAIGVAGVTAAFLASQEQIDDWAKSLDQGGKTARTATDEMTRAHDTSIADAHSLGDAWNIVNGAFADGLAQIEGYSSALDAATQKAQDMYNAMPLQQRVQQDVTTAQNDLNQAIDDYGQNSSAAKYQAWLLGLANDSLRVNQQELKVAADGLNGSLAGQVSLQQQLAQSGVGLDQATLNVSQSISNYKKVAKDAKATDDDRASSLDNVAQSMFGVLDAAKRKADAETQGMPQSIITNQEIVRQRDALDGVVKKLGFVPPALQGMYDSLNGPTAQALQATETNVNNMGTAMTTVSNNDITGTFLPALGKIATAAGHTIPESITGGFIPSTDKLAGQLDGRVDTSLNSTMGWMGGWMNQMGVQLPATVQGPFVSATDQARVHMQLTGGQADTTAGQVAGLGQDIIGLPGSHNTVITADATQANNTINDFLARMNKDGFVGAAYNLTPLGAPAPSSGLIGLPPVPHKATGGPIAGPGTGTSDSVLIAASNGEHMWTAAEVAAAGGHAGVEALRRSVLASGGGLAAGGPVPTSVAYPFDLNNGIKAHLAAQAAAAAVATAVPDVGPVGAGMTWPALDRIRRSLFPNSVLTSAYRAGANDWHGRGDAIDIGVGGNAQSGLMPIAATLARLYPGSTELIHNPNGSIKNGSPVGPGFWGAATWAEHANHVHWAMTPNALAAAQGQVAAGAAAGGRTRAYGDGGIVTRPHFALVGEAGPEAIVPLSNPARRDAVLSQAGLNPATGTGHAATTMPGYGVVNVAVAVQVTDARITGRLEMGADGMATLVDGRIETLAVKIKDRMAGAGVGA